MLHSTILNKVGDRYNDFLLTKIHYIDEQQCELRELEHVPTGAKIMHIANDDPENLFCLSFQTLPSSSNGVAHILEHTVLCGSKKFPIKDPFFSMGRRSLNTFLNALTGSDFTCYPAATQVEKDYYNLLEVYIDAVFHPELKNLSFLQEGHRLEFSDPLDTNSPLLFKGVVFNEMKGSLASAESRLWQAMMHELCPDLTYANNSGGDPKEIPHLSYEELKEFHRTFYQPSRCLFFFYGNFPLKHHLDFITEKVLKDAPKLPALESIPLQRRFKKAVVKEMHFPVTETEELVSRTMVAFGWLTTPLLNPEEVLALSIIDSVLMDTDVSLLKLPLLESELCIHADGYMDTEMSEVPYVIVCKGCKQENAEALEKVLRSSLEKIIETGIPSNLIESALHQLEFSRTEIVGDHSPFGLTLFMRSALAKQHGCNPENALKIHELFEKLNEHVKDPTYLTNLIKKYLLDNPHFVRLIMIPDPKLAAQEIKEEEETLAKIQASLTKKEIENIVEQTKALNQYQKDTETQNIDCLPKVDLSDVPILNRDFLLELEEKKGIKIYHHECFTNHITYADLVFDLPAMEQEDLYFLQLFSILLPEVGCNKRKYGANIEYIHAYTGGIGASCSLQVQASDPQKMNPCFSIRGKSLHRHTKKLLTLLKETSEFCRFDEKKRIQELISQLHNSLQSRLSKNALRYAIQLSLSALSVPSAINNKWYGLEFYKFIQELNVDINKKLPFILEKLNELKEKILCVKNPHLVLTCDKNIYKEIHKKDFYGLLEIPQKDFTPWVGNYPLNTVTRQAHIIASPVAYNCEAFKARSYIHPHSPALTVATHLLENKVLHRAVREQGGAYGSGASYNLATGAFYFHSYRDPHIANTLAMFHKAIRVIAAGEFNEKDLEESKLEVIQQFDMPVAPGSRGATAYSWLREGKTKEMRQSFRDRLLSLTPKEVALVVEKELLSKIDSGIFVTFAGGEILEKENLILAKDNKAFPLLST